MSEVVEIEGYGQITFGVVHNREPQRLPWYKNASKIPAEMRAAAEKVAAEKSSSDREIEWRMQNWSAWMIGWSFNVRCYYPWFMMSPEEALQRMSDLCMHDWASEPERMTSENKILGTWERGYHKTCKKCGEREYVRTGFNNWSGD
ncbi:hypothetical protein [Actinomycetia phage DSL-LC01]|nr:hypothetical protein [Actinomycetia phage DSL-LC01]